MKEHATNAAPPDRPLDSRPPIEGAIAPVVPLPSRVHPGTQKSFVAIDALAQHTFHVPVEDIAALESWAVHLRSDNPDVRERAQDRLITALNAGRISIVLVEILEALEVAYAPELFD